MRWFLEWVLLAALAWVLVTGIILAVAETARVVLR